MAFTPEDGTGLAAANSYLTEAFALAYHADRGNAAWAAAATDALRQEALVRATDYIDQRFGAKFRGWRQSKAQALEWPRIDAFDNDEFLLNDDDAIPRQLQKACAEYALRALTTPVLAPDNTDTGISATRKKVGPIEVEQIINNSTAQSGIVAANSIPDYPVADLWIAELLKSSKSRTLRRG